MRGVFPCLQRLCGDRQGAISILAAFVLVSVVGVSALALEYGHGLLQKVENQRVADLAAYGGALVYGATGSTPSAKSAAANIAALNGVSSGATPSVVNSPTGDGNSAVRVIVTTSVPLLLARVLTTSATMPVTATAYAEIKSDAPACIIALSGSGTGITMNGGTNLTASSCAVASNNSLTLSGGAALVTQNVNYGKTAPSVSGGASISAPSGKTLHTNRVTTTDPLAPASGSPGSTEVSNATARISTVSSMVSPTVSTSTGGSDVYFDYNGKNSTTIGNLNTDGCPTATFDSTSNTWTVACNSIVSFGNVSLQGGLTVNFTTAATYNFSASTVACNGTTGYSICNTGTTLTFGGPSTFVLQGGIYNGGGATLSLGSGTTNSYNIGKASDGNSINASTSKATTLFDATGSGDLFRTAGNITSSGGTCLWIPAAAEHDINGYISLAGGTTFGAGIYTVTDSVTFGNNGGGAVTCGGNQVGVIGSGVTFVIGGVNVMPPSKTTVPAFKSTCSGQAFCAVAGYSYVTLTAPNSGNTANLVVIGPTLPTTDTAGATFAEGATNVTLSGAFYFPQGQISMSGAGTINNGGGCVELIGSQVTLSGGSSAASTCAGLSGSSLGTTVTVVQ